MSFPKYKIKKTWFSKVEIPDGWEDLGLVKKIIKLEGEKRVSHIKYCTFCNDRARVGREGNGEMFYFCDRCEKKLLSSPPSPPTTNKVK